jgi:hypothetical protein
MLDLPLLHRCLDDLSDRINKETTENALKILIRGIGVGIFLRRLNENR